MYSRKTIVQLMEEAEAEINPVTKSVLKSIVCSRAVELEVKCNKDATIARRMNRLAVIRKLTMVKRCRLGLLLTFNAMILLGIVLVYNSITFVGEIVWN
jgi:hypothetical protein